MKKFKSYLMIGLVGTSLVLTSCGDDDAPEVVNDPEVITDVTLVFTNVNDATDIVRASANDPDDIGVLELTVSGPITLSAGATYELTYEIENRIDPNDIEDVLNDDIANELDEHQVFYAWTDGVFTNPTGNGNILASSTDGANAVIGSGGSVDYQDTDGALPVGLTTRWTTVDAAATGGAFRAKLQHQPEGLKNSTSDSNTGDSDFDLTFVITVTQ